MEKKPIRRTRDKFDHFRAEFRCPVCQQFLCVYTFGRAWTDEGLSEDKRTDCTNCGQPIDWSDVPLPPAAEEG